MSNAISGALTPFNRWGPDDQPMLCQPDYPETARRTPARPLLVAPLGLTESSPLDLSRLDLPSGFADITHVDPRLPRAQGQLIHLRGRVLDETGRPVAHALLELWQANASGRYTHAMDRGNPAPLEDNFEGSTRMFSDDKGYYELLTIRPGAYAVPSHPKRLWRPPHIHLAVWAGGMFSRLITQLYFPGDPLNTQDFLLNAVPTQQGRDRLMLRQRPMLEMHRADVIGYAHDLVIRGPARTPFESGERWQ